MGGTWTRLTSAVTERRSAIRLFRRAHEICVEQGLRVALGQWQVPSLRPPSVSLRGDFSRLPESRMLRDAFHEAAGDISDLPEALRRMEGMSGQRYRGLINALVRQHPDARYLEVGSYTGSTAAAAMLGNAVSVLCIDNWSEFGGPKAVFLENIARARSASVDFRLIESDFREVDYGSIGTFNIYLFDGPHGERDQYDAIMLVRPALDRRVIVIVDDWNWPSVRIGTFRALLHARYTIEAAIEIRTSPGPLAFGRYSDWHNGYLLSVCTAS
jgi:hypothetical protein